MNKKLRKFWNGLVGHLWVLWHLPQILYWMGQDDAERGNTLT